MASERELLITIKARDQATAVMKGAEKATADLSKTVKKSESEFNKFAKQFIALGFAFQTVKRIAQNIEGVRAFQEDFYKAAARGVEELAAKLGIVGDLMEKMGRLFSVGSASIDIEKITKDLNALKDSLIGKTDAGETVIGQLEAQLADATHIRNIIEQSGVSRTIAEKIVAEINKAAAQPVQLPRDLLRDMVASGFGGVNIAETIGLGDTPEIRDRVRKSIDAIKEEFARAAQTKKLAEKIAEVYRIPPEIAQQFAAQFVDNYIKAFEAKQPEIEESLTAGFRDAAANIADEFENLTRIGEQFANDLFNVLSENFFRAAKQEFRDFGEFAKSILRGILDSILAILSRLAASQLINLGSGLFPNSPTIPLNPASGGGSNGIPFPVPTGTESGLAGASAPITIVINATDANSFAQMLSREPAAIVNALTTGLSRNNTLRTGLRGAIQ